MIRSRPFLRRFSRRIARDERGMTLVEFAFVAPVFILMVIGLLDIGQLIFARAVLQGAVEDVSRDTTLETGDSDAADEEIERILGGIAPGADVDVERLSYFDFADVGRAEWLDDENGNGDCDPGENYLDENNSGGWEADIGVDGNGGAGDVVMYSVTVTFDRLFKVPMLPGSDEYVIQANTIKKNQPFADQAEYSTTQGTC